MRKSNLSAARLLVCVENKGIEVTEKGSGVFSCHIASIESIASIACSVVASMASIASLALIASIASVAAIASVASIASVAFRVDPRIGYE